jgi:hypothetical protein
MYMTRGNKTFDKKRGHNLGQMHRWIRDWRRGISLAGGDAKRRWSFAYNDIDHVIGLSVIDGDDVRCIFESDAVRHSGSKLAACATITDAVFNKLTMRAASIRDLADVLYGLQACGTVISEAQMLSQIDQIALDAAAMARDQFSGWWYAADDLNESWNQTRQLIASIKNEAGATVHNSVLSELRIPDLVWLSVAERSLARQLAPPGGFGALILAARLEAPPYAHHCIVAAHKSALSEHIENVPISQDGLTILSTIEFGVDNPARIIAASKIDLRENELTKALLGMRERALRSS